MKENKHEMVPFVEMAKNLGVDNVRITAVIYRHLPDYHNEHYDEILEYENECKNLADDNFTVFSSIKRMKRENFGWYVSDDKCHYSHLAAVIGADMMIYSCCEFKYRPIGAVASFADRTLKEAWESEERNEYYNSLDLETDCETCSFKPKNDFIKYMIDDNPGHVNYI